MTSSSRASGYALGLATFLALAACGSNSHSDAGETVVATPSVSGPVTAVNGSSRALSIPFNASESSPISNLTVTAGLSSLPAGWSGPATFTCGTVSTGNGCMLNLTFAPTGASSGTLEIDYTYTTSDGVAHTGSMSIPYASTSDDNVVGTASPSGQITATAGAGSQSVAVTFNTDDGAAATALSVTTNLTGLPAGWSSTATSFTCASVSTGNGCQLPLTYAPTVAATGALTLDFSYTNDSGTSKTGTVTISYAATTNDSVVATAAPSGQVNAVLNSGTQSVAVTFTTDDGQPASGLSITSSLTSLAPGWSTTSSTFSCGTVSTGNGCQLVLSYTPTVVVSGTLHLAYSYTNNAGTARTGTADIPYSATTHDTVTGSASPSGQVNALVNSGAQTVNVTFTTDDGNVATTLALTTSLGSLPSGWSSTAQSFTCANVSTGNSCQLAFRYAPTTVSSGTVSLQYGYNDNAGTAKTGTVNIPYASTSNNNVTGTVTPSGTVTELVNGTQAVSVTFTTDDGNPASQLSVTSGLTSLPSGWTTGSSTFTCSSVSTGAGCSLGLTYQPTAVASGTISLAYGYTNNAGTAKTGTISIPYSGTIHNNVVDAVSPAPVNTNVGSSQTVVVTFTTDDSNTATGLAVTSGLSALPSGWTSNSSTFTCATIASGTGCGLSLTYAPTSATSGTPAVSLSFSYTDNAGTAKTGTVSIAYTSRVVHAYVLDASAGIYMCSINSDGTLNNCATTLTSISGLTGLTFQGGFVYLSDFNDNLVYICNVATDGSIDGSSCAATGSGFSNPAEVVFAGSHAYVAAQNGSPPVSYCSVDATTGLLSNCAGTGTSSQHILGLTTAGGFIFDQAAGSATVDVCSIANDGSLPTCSSTGALGGSSDNIFASGGYLYAGSGSSVLSCPINSNGTLGTCASSTVASGPDARTVTISNGYAYLATETFNFPNMSSDVYVCAVSSTDGSLSNCTLSDGGVTFSNAYKVAVH